MVRVVGIDHLVIRVSNYEKSKSFYGRLFDFLSFEMQDLGATIVDPAGEYYDDYYAVFFLDPDGLKLEGMKYGERRAREARKRAAVQ